MIGDLMPRDRLMRLRPLLDELFKVLVTEERQTFAGLMARMVYVFEVDRTPKRLVNEAHSLRKTANKVAHEIQFVASEADVTDAVRSLARLIGHFGKTVIPQDVAVLYTRTDSKKSIRDEMSLKESEVAPESAIADPKDDVHEYSAVLPFVRAVVLSVGDLKQKQRDDGSIETSRRLYLEVETPEDHPRIALLLYGEQAALEIWKFATIHALDIKNVKDDLYISTSASAVVLEPDILLNASDLAECVQRKAHNPIAYFLNRFSTETSGISAVAGTIIGNIFAQIIDDPSVHFNQAYNNAIRDSSFAVSRFDDDIIHKEIYIKAQKHFLTLKETRQQFMEAQIEAEPTYISPRYGLLGRLDALARRTDGVHQIIELKSGKAPSFGVWPNHAAQANAYQMIHESVFADTACTSSILYSGSDPQEDPLRNVLHTPFNMGKLIQLRNEIICYEHALTLNDYDVLREIYKGKFGELPAFAISAASELADLLANVSDEERQYFLHYCAFVAREHWIARIGSPDPNASDNGFSGLWLDQPLEKPFLVLASLQFVGSSSDDLRFQITIDAFRTSSFREGDIVVVYPQEENGQTDPQHHRLVKARIAQLDREAGVVSISSSDRNLKADYFRRAKYWVIESDLMDRSFVSLYSSLVAFLKAPVEKRSLVLGLESPRFRKLPDDIRPKQELNSVQEMIWRKALEAQDYFLLQGPPGTGKTSYMLKEIVRHIHENTDENILLLAFTNRAVNEICKAIGGIQFIKLGSYEGLTEDQRDNSIAYYARTHTIEQVRQKIAGARIVVSTVSSCLNNMELFDRKQFHTTIVDEASQLLEPHLAGIITRTERFILIGDEKQLPAVVTQSSAATEVTNESLRKLGINDLRMSVFERLLRRAKENNWDGAFGQLEMQARMHSSISIFPAERFYRNKLKPFLMWQLESFELFPKSPSKEERILNERRVLFIPSSTQQSGRPKTHAQEAQIVVDWAKKMHDAYKFKKDYSPERIGIITPFRAQISEIYNRLPPELKTITVDTIERYQGSERDVIIVSFALTHLAQIESIQSQTKIEGIEVDRKLNVALTRAKQYIILVGNPHIMRKSPHLEAMIEWAQGTNGSRNETWFD